MKIKGLLCLITVVTVSAGILTGCGGKKTSNGGNGQKPADQTTDIIESKFAEVKPTIDGLDNDELWQSIEPKSIVIDTQNSFEMKTSYDSNNIYFLFKWISPDKAPPSIGKWFKKDGKWTWEFITDGFSILWDTSKMPDFAKQACTPLCHQESEDLNHRFMTTTGTDYIQEIWEWNPGVINQKNIMGAYLIGTLPDGVTYEDENFDNKVSWEHLPGEYGYHRNRATDAIAPAEEIKGDTAPFYILSDKAPSGDAGLVVAKGSYEEPFYILEIARPRTPANIDLTKFSVSDNGWLDILFGCSIHYKSERDLHKSMPVAATLRMVGKNAK